MEKVLLTVEEAAERLSLGRTKVYELVSRGELESVVIGRCRRIPVQALDHLVATLRQDGTVAHRSYTMGTGWSRTAPAEHGVTAESRAPKRRTSTSDGVDVTRTIQAPTAVRPTDGPGT